MSGGTGYAPPLGTVEKVAIVFACIGMVTCGIGLIFGVFALLTWGL